MKCGYVHCNLGKEVEREIAIKYEKKYYHTECFAEKQLKSEIESYFRENINTNEPVAQIRRYFAQYHLSYDLDYIMWCLKNKSQKLKYSAGLNYVLSDGKNIDEFNKIKLKQVELVFDNEFECVYNKIEPIKTKTIKKWGDYFG